MPAPTPQDIERLLAPISPGAPAGEPLRHQGVYEKIREARREDDASLPQGVWARPLKVADWTAVVSTSSEAIERKSKDLQIAAWLADAWAHLHGVVGAARGLSLVAGMLDRFWDGMFPELDDGDSEPRARLIEWLDEALGRRLRAAKLGDDRVSVIYGDWERVASGAELDDGAPSREALMARMSMVSVADWSRIHDEIGAAIDALAVVDRISGERFDRAPPLRSREILRAMEALCAEMLEALGAPPRKEESPPMGAEVREGARVTEVQAGGAPAGPISSRAEAYQRLIEAADYLLRTEPHSPVPYLVKRAISWGNMPLTELLQEFISGADDLVTTHRLLGMRQREE